MTKLSLRNLGLDLMRATEAAALAAGRWMGVGRRAEADAAAALAMEEVLHGLEIDGRIVVGETSKLGESAPLTRYQTVGTGIGPAMDVVVDPIDGRTLLAQGQPGAIAVAAVAPRGAMWSPGPAAYMEKLVVAREVAAVLALECLDAPAAWTLALVARAKQKAVRDLVVFVLDRPRHQDLIDEIRTAGARVMLRTDGDIAGALMVAAPGGSADLLLGIGGASEGIIAACAVKALGGAMLGRLAPQSDKERTAVQVAGLDTVRILTVDDLIAGSEVFFTATGVTDGPLLAGVQYHGNRAETESLVLRGETGTRRLIHAEHLLEG